MNRQQFIKNSLLGIGGLMMPASVVRASVDFTTLEGDFIPYKLNLTDPDTQNLLKSKSLPDTIRISASQNLGKNNWYTGEGIIGSDKGFQTALQNYNGEVPDDTYKLIGAYTPTTLLKTANHDVYGQYLITEGNRFKHGIIRGFDKQFYVVHDAFRRVFTYKYSCYGLPAADFELKRCRYCNELQVVQKFQKICDGNIVNLYAYPSCSDSKSGLHSFITNFKAFQPCNLKDDKLDIGGEF